MRHVKPLSAAFAVLFLAGSSVRAEDPAAGADAKLYEQTVSKAVGFLKSSQAENGSYSQDKGPAVTAIITTGLLRCGRTANDPQVSKGLAFIEGFVKPDGGIYDGELYRNYETCLSILCLTEANGDERYSKTLAGAEAFIKGLQWDGEEGHDESSVSYGGAGYGNHKSPDLSNTSFLLDALKSLGNGPEDEAVKKALIFVSRCQNLESEHNTTKFAAVIQDGGFYYTIARGGVSQAGGTDEGGLRSYASMTYAGLKSMIFAGVSADDPRVQAAVKWAQDHYDLKSNPGMGPAGLFYYYHTFAKALDAMGLEEVEDAEGVRHDWRRELIDELAGRQLENGSWVNQESERWFEGDPNLVTGYALLTLSYCRPTE